MVSDFIDEHNGYLRLTDEEFIQAVDKVDGLQKEARAFLEYGKNMKNIGLCIMIHALSGPIASSVEIFFI